MLPNSHSSFSKQKNDAKDAKDVSKLPDDEQLRTENISLCQHNKGPVENDAFGKGIILLIHNLVDITELRLRITAVQYLCNMFGFMFYALLSASFKESEQSLYGFNGY